MDKREGGSERGERHVDITAFTCSIAPVVPPLELPLTWPLPPPVSAASGGPCSVRLCRSEERWSHLLHELRSPAAVHDTPHQRGEPGLGAGTDASTAEKSFGFRPVITM